MGHASLLNAYDTFFEAAKPYLVISNEAEYEAALAELDDIFEQAEDTKDDPRNLLIDLIAGAIEQYEMQDQELQQFITEADAIPSDIALLKVLMSQHKLTGSDLPEIGDKTMVSKVLKGTRQLSRPAIEKLSERFSIRPSMFFGEAS